MSLYWQTRIFLDHHETYDGTQLRPGYLAERFGLWGNAQVIFQGPARVETGHMVDRQDAIQSQSIQSSLMLHLLAQWYHLPWEVGPLCLYLNAHFWEKFLRSKGILAEAVGNDVYVHEKKINVSIATAGDGCVLIHVGVNVVLSQGDYANGIGLKDLGIDPTDVVQPWAHFWDDLVRRWMRDLYKVRWVSSSKR